jgi:hypothetical protein
MNVLAVTRVVSSTTQTLSAMAFSLFLWLLTATEGPK